MTINLRKSSLASVAIGAFMLPLAAFAFEESPMLAERVAAGSLPEVSARLPDSPEVVTPLEEVGQYGGTIRRFLSGSNDHNSILRFVSPQGLTRWDPEFSKIIPNVAESWSINEDSSEFTFNLRKGLKWSDGVPLTVDDILFWYYDMTVDADARDDPVIPGNWLVDRKPVKMEKIDDLTIKDHIGLQQCLIFGRVRTFGFRHIGRNDRKISTCE